MINEELPPELRDVFFTDGDRALSFIEADVALSTKRERVQRAIRSLLGLGVIEDAIKHARKAASDVNKQAKQAGAGGELNRIASRLEMIDDETSRLEVDLEDAKQQFSAFDEKVEETDKKIATALQKGDREQLKKDLETAKRKIKQLDDQLTAANKEHAALFREARRTARSGENSEHNDTGTSRSPWGRSLHLRRNPGARRSRWPSSAGTYSKANR